MLALFKYNRFGNSLLLLVYALILRIPAFMPTDLQSISTHSAIFDSGMPTWPTNTLLGQFAIAFMIFLQAAMINRLIIHNRVMIDINLYPGLFYILIMSFTPVGYSMHLLLLANFAVILSISEIFLTFKNLDSKGRPFNSGVLTAFASLIYSPYILFVIFNYISIASLRSFKIRERVQLILGVLSPFFIASVWYLWTGRQATFLHRLFNDHLGFVSFRDIMPTFDYIVYAIFGVITLWALVNYQTYTTKKNMQAIKKVNILFWFIMFVGLSLTLQQSATIAHLILLSIPLSIFVAMSFSKIKRSSIAEAVHLLLFLGSLFLNAKLLALL